MTNVRAAILVFLGTAAAAISLLANNVNYATQDMTDYNPLLVQSLMFLVACLAFLQAPIRHASRGWRFLAIFVMIVSLLNGSNAVFRLLVINLR
jgi:Zn-dependent membrane protease YugP